MVSDNRKVFVSGVFDCFHKGHKELLVAASLYGNVFVAVNNDAYVRKHKGKGRPVDKALTRMMNVIQSGYVSLACINEKASPLDIILAYKPDYIVVGSDYTIDKIVGLKESASWGGKAIIVPRVNSISTTQIINSRKHA